MFEKWTLMKIHQAEESYMQANMKGFITFGGNDVQLYY